MRLHSEPTMHGEGDRYFLEGQDYGNPPDGPLVPAAGASFPGHAPGATWQRRRTGWLPSSGSAAQR